MKIFNAYNLAKIYVYEDAVSMSKSFAGLSEIVSQKMHKKPDSEDLYVFVNKKRDYLKILFWYKNGSCIFAKKLPVGIFDAEGIEGNISLQAMEKIVNEVIISQRKKG